MNDPSNDGGSSPKRPRLDNKFNYYEEGGKINPFRVAERRVKHNIFVSREKCVEKKERIPQPVEKLLEVFDTDFIKKVFKTSMNRILPLQSQAWPVILRGNDMIGVGATETDRRLAFILPGLIHSRKQRASIFHRNGPTVIFLCLSQKMALDIKTQINEFNYENIKCYCVEDDGEGEPKIGSWNKEHFEIIAATPEYMHKIIQDGVVNFQSVSYVVLHETDSMLSEDFTNQVDAILSNISPHHQVIITSATWNSHVQKLAESVCVNPIKVTIRSLDLTENVTLKTEVFKDEADKMKTVTKNFKPMTTTDKIVVFCKDDTTVLKIADELNLKGIHHYYIFDANENVAEACDVFKSENCQLLITDVAARDLNLTGFTHIFNYDFPSKIEDYLDCISKACKTGSDTKLISLLSKGDWPIVPDLVAVLREMHQVVPSMLYDLAAQFECVQFLQNPSFYQLANTEYFVDKSLIINEIVGKEDQFLFTAPRKMGKTAILNMLECFFNINTPEEKRSMFEKLKIGQHPDIIKKHFHQYPILWVDMSDFGQLDVKDKEMCYRAMRIIVHKAYEKHESELPNNDIVQQWANDKSCLQFSDEETVLALYRLAVLLENRYKKPVILLCDEFDSICEKALSHKVTDETLEEIIRTYFALFTYLVKSDKKLQKGATNVQSSAEETNVQSSAEETNVQSSAEEMNVQSSAEEMNVLSSAEETEKPVFNERLIYRAVFSGVTAVASSGASPLNTLDPDKFLESTRFSDFYGILKSEFEELLDKPRFEKLREEMNFALDHYNGYRTCNGRDILCTYSIAKYLSNVSEESKILRIKNYWKESGPANRYIDVWSLDCMQKPLDDLINGKPVRATKFVAITANDLIAINAAEDMKIYSIEKVSLLYAYLQQLGYFNIFKYGVGFLELEIPNKEISGLFVQMRATSLLKKLGLTKEFLWECTGYFNQLIDADEPKADLENISTFLSKLCETRPWINKIPSQDKSIPEPSLNESTVEHLVYAALLLSKFSPYSQEKVENPKQANRTTWNKFDLFFHYLNFGIMIELKYDQENAEKALLQIKEKKCYELFKNDQLTVKFDKKLFVSLHVTKNSKITFAYTNDIEKFKSSRS